MRILVSEITSHQKNLPHLFKLFSHRFDTTIFIHFKEKKSISNIPKENLYISSLPKSLLYWYLCCIAPRYNYIFLSTGPEYALKASGIISILGFYMLTLLFPSKVILHIRNTNNYLPEKNFFSGTIIQNIRVRSARHIKRFTFDSILTLDYFKSKFQLSNSSYQSIIAINYSDVRFLKQKEEILGNNKIIIGLIGRIDLNRKDYNHLFDLLLSLGQLSRRFEFIILGQLKDINSHLIISKIQESSSVIFRHNYITDNEFEELGLSCHILFAPLTDNYGYGVTKETGAFGDAIYLHKKIIIPQFACTNGEFDPISEYYNNPEDLLKIFIKIADNSNNDIFKVDPDYLSRYSTTNIFKQITEDLHL
jgi:hypothetical protein